MGRLDPGCPTGLAMPLYYVPAGTTDTASIRGTIRCLQQAGWHTTPTRRYLNDALVPQPTSTLSQAGIAHTDLAIRHYFG